MIIGEQANCNYSTHHKQIIKKKPVSLGLEIYYLSQPHSGPKMYNKLPLIWKLLQIYSHVGIGTSDQKQKNLSFNHRMFGYGCANLRSVMLLITVLIKN